MFKNRIPPTVFWCRIVGSILMMVMFSCGSMSEFYSIENDPTWVSSAESRHAIQKYKQSIEQATLDELIQIIQEKEDIKCEAALQLLSKFNTPSVIKTFQRVAQDPTYSMRVRGQAALMLSKLPDQPEEKALIEILEPSVNHADAVEPNQTTNHKDYLKNKTTEAIGKIGGARSTTIMENQLEKSDSILKVTTYNALNRLKENNPSKWQKEDMVEYQSILQLVVEEFEKRYQGERKTLSIIVAGFIVQPDLQPSPLTVDFEEELLNAMVGKQFQIISQYRIQEIMRIQEMQQFDFYDDTIKLKVGKLVQANTMITGSLTPVIETEIPYVRLRMEVISMESGIIMTAWGYNIRWDSFIGERVKPVGTIAHG